MSGTLIERLTKTTEGMRLYQQERAIQELTDLACEIMQEQDVSRSELARRIGKTKGYITQLLDGRTNMTVRTISDVFVALDRAVHFQEGPLDATVSAAPLLSWDMEMEMAWADYPRAWPGSIVITYEPRAIKEKLAG